MDKLNLQQRAENMRRINSKGMRPELTVRQAAHGLGYRFRLHRKDLPGTPDIVFPKLKKIIMVHGCFWHSHNEPNCVDGQRKPKSNVDYWIPKLERNSARDRRNIELLEKDGYSVLVVWECETRNREVLAWRLKHFLTGNLACSEILSAPRP